jgi:hypothetical protein
MENEGTQYPGTICDGVLDGVTADTMSQLPTSHEGPDSHGDDLLPNAGAPNALQCGDESANTPVSASSSGETVGLDDFNSEPRIETHAVHDPCHTVSDDDQSRAQGNNDEPYVAQGQVSQDAASPDAVSHPLRQRKKQSSRSGRERPPSHLPESCSISVVMSEPESLAPGNKRPVTRRRTGRAGKRKNRPKYRSDVNSDDSDDDDYVDGNDSPAGIGGRPHPTKRRRRTVAPKIASDRLRYRARDITPAAAVSSPDQVADHAPTTGLHDIETIPIQGFLTRHVFLSRIVYTCSFQEDREPPFLYKPAGNATDGEDECRNRNVEPSTSKKPLAHTPALGGIEGER